MAAFCPCTFAALVCQLSGSGFRSIRNRLTSETGIRREVQYGKIATHLIPEYKVEAVKLVTVAPRFPQTVGEKSLRVLIAGNGGKINDGIVRLCTRKSVF
jgi:hypothetical protein